MYQKRQLSRARTPRAQAGLARISALREIVLISIGAVLVLWVLCEADSVLGIHFSPQEQSPFYGDDFPVLSLDFDHDRQSVIIQSYPDSIEEIRLADSQQIKSMNPAGLLSIANSRLNSTSILLTQWTEGHQLQFTVSVIRGDQFLYTEKITFPDTATADVRLSDDGQIAALITDEGYVAGWDFNDSKPKRWEFRLPTKAQPNRLSPDGKSLFAASGNGDAAFYCLETGERKVSIQNLPDSCRGIEWSEDGKMIAMSDSEGGLRVFDVATGLVCWQHKLEFVGSRSLALSPDGKTLVVGGFDKLIRIFDLSTSPGSIRVLAGSSSAVMDLTFTSNPQKIISGCIDGTVCEWSLASHELIRQLR